MSKSLAFASKAARVTTSSKPPEEAQQVSLGLQGLRIHHLMDSLQGHNARQDPELQSKLGELKRILGGLDPLLDKVEKRLGHEHEHQLPTDGSGGGAGMFPARGELGSAQAAAPAHGSTDGQRGAVEADVAGDDRGCGSDEDLDVAKKVR